MQFQVLVANGLFVAYTKYMCELLYSTISESESG